MYDLLLTFSQLPTLTQGFVIVIFLAALYVHSYRFTAGTVLHGPTIFTTIGIFATFLGIAIGLLNFDASRINESVPELIAGIKTAFWASVFGVLAALSIKLRYALLGLPAREKEEEFEGATIDDLANLLKSLQHSIAGREDSTLLSQMKLSRQDTNDRLDALKRSMQEYLAKMAESNSKALIEALKEVIRDFNAKINEQFGENFKHLNEAVGKVLVWQEKYSQQMTEMIQQQVVTTQNM